MSKVEVATAPGWAPPAGYPKARASALARRVRDTIVAVAAAGETVAAVEVSPEGAVRVWTTSAATLPGRGANEWDEVLSPAPGRQTPRAL